MEHMKHTQPQIQHLTSSDIAHITLFQGTNGRYSVTVILKNKNVIDIWSDKCELRKFNEPDGSYSFGALEIEDGKWGV